MIKKTLLILVVCTFYFQGLSQNTDASSPEVTISNSVYQNNSDFQQYWSFGGGLGLSFWDDQTSILLAPKAYYNVSPQFFTGFGVTYIYSDFDSGLVDYKSNSFGGSVMAGVRPIPYLQFDMEYEGLQTSRSGLIKEDFWNNALYLGLSFVSGKVSFGFRYDVLYDDKRSLYASAFNPVVGFYF